MKLDDICEELVRYGSGSWDETSEGIRNALRKDMARVMRKLIEPLIAEAHDDGQHFAAQTHAVNRDVAVAFANRIVTAITS